MNTAVPFTVTTIDIPKVEQLTFPTLVTRMVLPSINPVPVSEFCAHVAPGMITPVCPV